MQISSIALHHLEIPLRSVFKHALAERRKTEAIVVAMRAETGMVGYGEILPREYLTGETIDRALRQTAPEIARRMLGKEFAGKDEVVGYLRAELDRVARDLACFCGFEIALLDLAGQTFGFPLGAVLGAEPGGELPAGVAIGFEVQTKALPKYCAALRLSGKRQVKLKVGLSDDLERLTIASHIFEMPLRLDANGAWISSEKAVRELASFLGRGIPLACIEQPIPAGDLDGLRRVREQTRIPVMVDESLCTLEDADRLIEARAADLFNVRLAKCGGLLGSQRLVQRAKQAGLSCHLGTLVGETGILSRAAEMFGRFVPDLECLDGKGQNEFLLAEDLLENPRDAREADARDPGLGIRVSELRLARYRRGDRIQFDLEKHL
jgi:L-alanine-DL-glutamate epimerase-like enolase superfamily enzyme